MKIQDFEKELQAIHKDLAIRPNNPPEKVLKMFPDADKLASITFCGSEICTIPNHEIFDEKSESYGVDLRQDGRFVAHRTRPEALQIVKEKVAAIQSDSEYADMFFGRGEYSDAALRKTEQTVEVVDTVEADIKPVENGTIEGSVEEAK